MTAATVSTPSQAGHDLASRLPAALKDGGFAALIMAGLGFPMLALRAEPDIRNQLVLQSRWSWLIFAVLLVFAGGMLANLLRSTRGKVPAFLGLLCLAFAFGYMWFAKDGVTLVSIAPLLAGLASLVGAFMIDPSGVAASARPKGAPFAMPARLETPLMIALIAALIAFPIVIYYWLGSAGSLKWINNYGIQILIFVMLGWGLNIVVGLAGLLDLGYVAFYAVGAYAYALLATTFGLSFWICLPLAGILAAFWGILLGFPVLRLRGDYLALVTLAFGEIIHLVLLNWSDLTNGEAGILSIPRVTFFGIPFVAGENGFAHWAGLAFSPIHRTIFLFYVILFLALLTNYATLRLRRLPIGRAWEALREDEIACRSLGINTVNTKLTAFALGAMFGGFAGSFFAVRQGFVNPNSFTFEYSAMILAIVVLGGMGSQIGVALAAVVMIGGVEALRELDFLKRIFGNDFDPTIYRMLIFGLAMVAMMVWRPRGFISTRKPTIFLRHRKAVSAEFVGQGHG